MSISKNSAGFENILEISKTSAVVFANGEFKKPGNSNLGFKIKAAAAGTIQVHYQGDADDRIVGLVVGINDVQVWLSDRVDRIVQSGTTIAANNILVGW